MRLNCGSITIRPSGIIFLVVFTLLFTFFVLLLSNNSFTKSPSEDATFMDGDQSDYFVEDVERRPARGGKARKMNDRRKDERNVESRKNGQNDDNAKIDSRVANIPDTRPLLCKYNVNDGATSQTNTKSPSVTVSLILVFNDYQFYELKKTIESFLVSESHPLVSEILVVDDASSLTYIKEEVQSFLASIPKTKLFKSSMSEPMGMANARNLAARESTGDVLVFVTSGVILGPVWLEPLLKQIREETDVIAVPHIDLIKDPISMEYVQTPDNSTYTLTWSLSIRPFEITEASVKRNDALLTPLVTDAPAMRGDVFAVSKKHFLKLGGYDSNLEDYGGGENVDMSLKAWLCGKGIKTVLCSRVGVLNAYDPMKVRSEMNRMRLADLWFSDAEHRSAVFRLIGSRVDGPGSDYHDLDNSKRPGASFLSFLMKSASCNKRSLAWYLNNVAINMVKLRIDAVAYGILKTGTVRCAHLIRVLPSTNNNTSDDKSLKIYIKIKLDECKPTVIVSPRTRNKNSLTNHSASDLKESIFQMTRDGRIIAGDNYCVTTKENGYIAMEKCRKERDDKQRFYWKDFLLINVWCGYCMMQVTDPDLSTPGDRQIAMVQPCDSYSDKEKNFMSWSFINL